ncbi:MAG: hypothetical protein PHY44_05735 [Lachnospiraceae bacterium]|nr:hypothetical protein [Lachnospiraceae bacterium]
MSKLTHEGFSTHTFELKKKIDYLKLRDLKALEYKNSKGSYRFYYDEAHRIYISERYKNVGVRLYFHENGEGPSPHIRLIINPRILIGDLSYTGIFEKTNENWIKLFLNLDNILNELGSDYSFEHFTVSRIDLCVNLKANLRDINTTMRLIRKCRIPEVYERVYFSSEEENAKEMNKNSFHVRRDYDEVSIYNKGFQMQQEGLAEYGDVDILRFEVQLKRNAIVRFLRQYYGSHYISNREILNFFAERIRDIMGYRLKDFFTKGYHLQYSEAQKIIDRNTIFTSKTRQRMKQLIYYSSQCKNLNIAIKYLEDEYSLNKKQIEQLLKNFEKINLSPITLKNNSFVLNQPGVLDMLGLSFYHGNETD